MYCRRAVNRASADFLAHKKLLRWRYIIFSFRIDRGKSIKATFVCCKHMFAYRLSYHHLTPWFSANAELQDGML